MSAVLLGLGDFVSFVHSLPSESNYFLGGFARFDQQVKQMMTILSFSAFLPEAVLAILYQNDRLAEVYLDIMAEIEDEMCWLYGVPHDVRTFVASGMHFRGNLSDEVFCAVASSSASITEGLRYMKELPRSLAIGDIDVNLVDLADQVDEPADETGRKIWLLLRMGYSRPAVSVGIARLKQVSHNAMTTEQAHAAGAVMMNLHRTYGDATIRARSFCYQLKPLFSADPLRVRVRVLTRQLESLRRTNPNRLGGKQAFAGEMLAMASKQKSAGRPLSKLFTKDTVRKHNAVWGSFSMRQKDRFRQLAEHMRLEKLEQKQQRLQDLLLEIAKVKDLMSAQSSASCVMTSFACRLRPAGLRRAESTVASWHETQVQVIAASKASCEERHLLAPHILQTLQCFEVQEAGVAAHRFPWLSCVCQDRDFFSHCCFRFVSAGDAQVLRFLYALQNPHVCAFVRGAPEEVVVPAGDAALQLRDASAYVFEHCYRVDWRDFVFSDEAFVAMDAHVEILSDGFTDRGGAMIKSDSSW